MQQRQSEWGKTPEQAAQMREFMLGVAEVISGVFCVTVSTGFGTPVASVIFGDGIFRMYSALNNIWAGHQAMIALKNWEQTSLKAAENEQSPFPGGTPDGFLKSKKLRY